MKVKCPGCEREFQQIDVDCVMGERKMIRDISEAYDTIKRLEAEISKLKEELDYQNMPNHHKPLYGGYEFYINEEWSTIRDGVLNKDCGFEATLMKCRYDPDDERVRVRRIIDDDAILQELEKLRK